MRTNRVELRHVRMPLLSPFETSFGRETERDCLILRLESDGLEGWGECVADRSPGYCYETVETAWHVLADFFLPAVLGADLGAPGDLASRLKPFRGHPLARAGLEMALWDLEGKRAGKSLVALLGGERERVPVGVSVGIQPSMDALLRTVEAYVEEGHRRVKLKIKPGRGGPEVRAAPRGPGGGRPAGRARPTGQRDRRLQGDQHQGRPGGGTGGGAPHPCHVPRAGNPRLVRRNARDRNWTGLQSGARLTPGVHPPRRHLGHRPLLPRGYRRAAFHSQPRWHHLRPDTARTGGRSRAGRAR